MILLLLWNEKTFCICTMNYVLCLKSVTKCLDNSHKVLRQVTIKTHYNAHVQRLYSKKYYFPIQKQYELWQYYLVHVHKIQYFLYRNNNF